MVDGLQWKEGDQLGSYFRSLYEDVGREVREKQNK